MQLKIFINITHFLTYLLCFYEKQLRYEIFVS